MIQRTGNEAQRCPLAWFGSHRYQCRGSHPAAQPQSGRCHDSPTTGHRIKQQPFIFSGTDHWRNAQMVAIYSLALKHTGYLCETQSRYIYWSLIYTVQKNIFPISKLDSFTRCPNRKAKLYWNGIPRNLKKLLNFLKAIFLTNKIQFWNNWKLKI